MEYKVISMVIYRHEYNKDVKDFVASVNKHIEDGWAAQGGISITWNDDYYLFAQALVKLMKST